MDIEVVLTPAEIAVLAQRDLRGAVCVVFDVLRATSTILTALHNGARRVYPVSTIEAALALRQTRRPGTLLGGERNGIRIDGFDLGNSPREYTPETVSGREIVTTTTNGTVALQACAGAEVVLAGALLDLRALGRYCRRCWPADRPDAKLLLVCAGTGPRFALEDGLAAGALIAELGLGEGSQGLDDAARLTLALWKRWRRQPLRALMASENGRRLADLGLDGDIEWCARESPLDLVAKLRDGALESEIVGPTPGP